MQDFRNFLEDLEANNKIDNPHFIYELFMKCGKEKFQKQSFLKSASNFFALLENESQREWWRKGLIPLQVSFLKCLFNEIGLDNQEVQQIITKLLQPSKVNNGSMYEQLENSINQIDGTTKVKEDLKAFIELSREHLKEYQEGMRQIIKKYHTSYKRASGTILFWTFQMIGAIENFSIMRKNSSDINLGEGINALFSPSHAHYLINPRETIFILAKTNLNYLFRGKERSSGGEVKEKLRVIKPESEIIYLFTFDSSVDDELFEEFRRANVKMVTTEYRKNKYYQHNDEVITIEELLSLCAEKSNFGKSYRFSQKQKTQIRKGLKKQLGKFKNFPLLRDWYQKQIDEFGKYAHISKLVF